MNKSLAIFISICITGLFVSLAFSSALFIMYNKYNGEVCSRVDILSAKEYNGTFVGGYSCFIKGDRIDVWFNPIGDNRCLSCDPYNYHFICYTGKYEFCFMEGKFLRVLE